MGLIDDFMDKVEAGVSMIEGMASRDWKAEEITDAESGESVWLVSDGSRKFESTSEDDATWLVGVLNSEAKKEKK